ncbi:TIGR02647 family protein [Aliiglaciecola sp. CAU 1673]|uniref:TIGR02647 family protein n=1 Tax=Aliiglaciecola sp. CAU 1673 TaxID=3032595 RepID=UPI0023DACB68|nr:TIGR02647 family protein [Aliiglaciecola sp. CAU 1673]MDF2179072.1 TIGR02647 family protein [Aliiglaciecola sp. CAU 1673]
MAFDSSLVAELNLLLKFPHDSLTQGLKIHHDADPQVVDAAKRLFDKGIINRIDGGYLTDLGHDLAEHAQILVSALNAKKE